jgi:hypothetical protein
MSLMLKKNLATIKSFTEIFRDGSHPARSKFGLTLELFTRCTFAKCMQEPAASRLLETKYGTVRTYIHSRRQYSNGDRLKSFVVVIP